MPVLAGVELREGVSVEAENFQLQDECVDIELSVTLAVEESRRGYGSVPNRSGASTTRSDTVPAYKDPDALRTVYEKYDTFPEMTEALGADVTSETVRRYMVEYDIHDPNDTRPQVHRHAAQQAGTETISADTSSNDRGEKVTATGSTETTGDQNGDASGDSRAKDAAEEPSLRRGGESPEPTSESTAPAETNDPNGTDDEDGVADPGGEASDATEADETSVAELIAETDSGNGDDSLVADGVGIPKGLTVSELATVVNESNTLYEAKQKLAVDQDTARRLLKETALMDLVTQRLGANQITVSPTEVRRRIERNASAPSR
jgi:hypothetical protein